MALALFDRVQETSTTAGTGSIILAGAVSGFQSFAVVGNGNTCYYTIVDGSAWEVGVGTYSTSGPTLARTTILSNSNGNTSPLTLTANSKSVFLTYPASKSVNLNESGNVSPLGTVVSGIWNGTTIGVAYGGTGVTASSGANSVVLRDSNQNITVNRINQGIQTITASGGTTVLTAASQFNQALVGTGGHTFRLPDATTLTDTTTFQFNNNATGTLTIQNNAGTTVGSIASGGAAGIALLSNATVGGTWDVHAYIPENVTWGTNALTLGSTVISGGTWQGGTIATGYGGTGLTSYTSGGAVYANSSSTLTSGTLPVTAGGTGNTSGQAASTASSATFNSGGAGDASGTTFNGSAARTISYNTIGAPSTTGTNASGTWGINITGSAGSAGSSTTSTYVTSQDIRTLSPSSTAAARMGFGFTSWANNNSAPYADYLALRSYTDASGGNDNLVMFNKSTIAMRVWQQSFGSASAYSSYADVLMSNNYNSYAPTLTGGGASGTWGINITGSAGSAPGYLPLSGGTMTGSLAFAQGANINFGSSTNEAGPWTISVINSGGATPATKGTGYGRNLIVKAGNSDNGGGLAGGDLYLRAGAPTAPATTYGVVYLSDDGGYTQAGGSLRAPIFYDSNDTGYYLNPNGTSNLFGPITVSGPNTSGSPLLNLLPSGNGAFQRGVRMLNAGMTGGDSLMYAVGIADNARNMGQFYFVYSGSGSTSNRVSMGLHSVDDVLNIFGTGNTSFGTTTDSGYRLNISGTGYATSDFRAPIFYDSNNTGYYVDPASTSNLVGLTVANTISGSINGNASNASNADALNGISAVGLFNNMGQAHGTRTSFDASTPSYGFGYRYVQGSTNGPNTGGTQYYSWYIGLGSEYPATGAGSYGAMFAVDRDRAVPYMSVRYNEGNSFSSWRKVAAGYADSAGSADYNGLSNKGGGTGTYTTSGDYRAPIFYDSNDTTYYVNPNAVSSMYGIAIRGDQSSTDSINQIFFWGAGDTTTSAIGFKANGGEFPNPTGFGDGYNTYFTMDSDGRGWVFRRGVGGSDFSSAYNAGWILNNGVWQANASMRAPIFYDSNDTGFYVDPANGGFNLKGGSGNRVTFATNDSGFLVINAEGNGVSDTRLGAAWGAPGIYSSSNLYLMSGASAVYWKIGNSDKGYMDSSSNLFAFGSMRSPIFYDSEDTSYYLNPNSISLLYRGRFGPFAGSQSGNTSALEIMNTGGTGDASLANITFHCQSYYGTSLHLRADGYFGVGGWSATTWRWYTYLVNGDMTAAGNVTAYSDPRLKTDITPIQSALSIIQQLNGVRFKWIESSVIGHPGEYDYGVLADEVQKVLPELVSDSMHEAPEGDKYKTVAYDKFAPILIESVKELAKYVTALEQRIAQLEARL